jgi:membrane protease YdiL (CAAX protease family)
MDAASQPGPWRDARGAKEWRQSPWLALLEFTLVGLVFVANHYHLIPVSRTPFWLALGWISLRVRRLRWRNVGFARPQNRARTLALGVGGGLALELFQLFVTQPLLARATGKQPDLSDFQILHANITYALVGVALSWTLAAFGEELVWRGYLLNRVAEVLGGRRGAWIGSLVVVSAVFGCAHNNQGLPGMIEEGLAGFFLGLMYLGTGKNLAVPIVAHGISDTLDVVLLFLGKMPGT